MTDLAPASAALETELSRTIKERGLVIWLDADGHYTDYVAGLTGRATEGTFPFPVIPFEGSFLELMLRLEPYGNGLHAEKVLIHMPGFNDQSISETPLYELFKAGKRFRKALDTLIEQASVGLVRPEEATEFRAAAPSLAEADSWLSAARAGEKNLFLLGLEAHSAESTLGELFTPGSPLVAELLKSNHAAQFLEYLQRSLGLPTDSWTQWLGIRPAENEQQILSNVQFLYASWLMAVEFVADLREAPVAAELQAISGLSRPRRDACLKLVQRLRDNHSGAYLQLSRQFEDLLSQDRSQHHAEALGSLDTFQFEEAAIRGAALTALIAGNWEVALHFARERSPESSFWVKHDKSRERTWQLIQGAARVGQQLVQAGRGLGGCASLEEANNRYRDSLFKVDRAHREFEQQFHKLHSTELENEAELRRAREAVRVAYRAWANSVNGSFAALCDEVGMLPSPELRQRAVYDHFVHPLVEGGERVAFFMVDAMRFEMAEELRKFFDSKKYRSVLNSRFAELPTVTEVGMNALAPVVQQRKLRPVVKDRTFGGFRCGDKFTVHSPNTRVKAMESRSVPSGAIHVELSEMVEASADDVKKILRRQNYSKLIVVRSLELDSAGEKGLHLGTFEQTLIQLREAVQKLQRAGIVHFVLASDHGFLLQDSTTDLIEYKDGPKRRHVFSPTPSGMRDALEVPLSALDYEAEGYLVFRRDTAIWKVKDKIAPFVHGGNSLQERIIPVLTLAKTSRSGNSTAQYEVVATAMEPEGGGRQRLSLQVRLQRRSTGELSFAGPRRISLALRVLGHKERPEIVEVGPPGTLESGSVYVQPGMDAAMVTFAIEGELEERVRVEVYHPDATENVAPKVVEGWFEMRRNRRLGKSLPPPEGSEQTAEQAPPSSTPAEAPASPGQDWTSSFEDEEFRKVFEIIESQFSINEQDLHMVLKNARRVRAFARRFDALLKLVPFEVEIRTVGGMKSYVKGDKR